MVAINHRLFPYRVEHIEGAVGFSGIDAERNSSYSGPTVERSNSGWHDTPSSSLASKIDSARPLKLVSDSWNAKDDPDRGAIPCPDETNPVLFEVRRLRK